MSFGTSSGSSQQQSQSFTPEQGQWLANVLSVYGPTVGQGQTSYTGDRVAGFTTGQTSALSQAQGYLDSFKPGTSMPLFSETGSAINDILQGRTGGTEKSLSEANQTFNDIYSTPAWYDFEKNVAPTAREEFAGPGYWGSARANAVTDKAADLQTALNSQRYQYLSDTEAANRALQEAKATRAASTIPVAMAYGMQPTEQALAGLQGTQSVFNTASTEQALQQQQIQADIQQFLEQNRLTDPEAMSIMMGLLGLNYSTGTGLSSNQMYSGS